MRAIQKINSYLKIGLFIALIVPNIAVASDIIIPSKITKGEVAGKIFQRPSMIRLPQGDGETLDVQNMLSSDKKFETGMYQAGASRFEIKDHYGVDEFMYFLKGSVTLTSMDGSVQIINAGEAVTIPKEWTGIWQTEGYTKFYVIYHSEKSPQ